MGRFEVTNAQFARFDPLHDSWIQTKHGYQFGVTGYPTTLFLSAKGAQIGNVPGYSSPQDFLLLLRFVGDGHAGRGEKLEDFVRDAKAGGARPRH